MIHKNCTQCGGPFEVTDDDLKFYEMISPVIGGQKQLLSPPTKCPICRHQGRLAFRNERNLYYRNSDLSGKQVVTIYSPDKPYKVYDQDEWWGDGWDPLVFGQDFDFNRNFTDQFRELFLKLPRMSLHTIGNENSYYTCYSLYLKNCYLIFGAGYNEDCMYAKYMSFSNDCLDMLACYSCSFCYQGVGSDGCYNCRYFSHCRNCSDCTMIEDCIACKDCIACFGLRNKQYCVLNNQLSKEKYEEFAEKFKNLSYAQIETLKSQLEALKIDKPRISAHIYASEDSTGDALYNCKNCLQCFHLKESEDCKYLYNSPKSIATHDGVYTAPHGVQYSYNVCSTTGTNLISTYFVWNCDNVYYSMDCQNSRNLFGCVGLKQKEYCIFNKQYTKEQYEELVPRIINHMQGTGEWGEYLSYKLAPCCYNETVAMEYFPLSKEEAQNLGASWYEGVKTVSNIASSEVVLPDTIEGVTEDICNVTLKCAVMQKDFKVLPAELAFYKRAGIPIPRRCPDQRHNDRLANHDFFRTYKDICSNCGTNIDTVYLPGSQPKVYCEKCYLKFMYN